MSVPYRETQCFEYFSEVKSIKTRGFKTFEKFKEYILNVLYDHHYTLYIYKLAADKHKPYYDILSKEYEPEKIANELERYFTLAASNYPLIFGNIIRFELCNIYDNITAIINYRNQIIDNIHDLDHNTFAKNGLTNEQRIFLDYLYSMIIKENSDNIFSKSVFDTLSDDKKLEFQNLKAKIKLQYLQNKIIEKQDNIVNELYRYSTLQYTY